MNKEQLEADLKKFEQLRGQTLLDIRNPEQALLNFHRLDAVVSYIQEKLQALQALEQEASE